MIITEVMQWRKAGMELELDDAPQLARVLHD
jgi:hypothetical protein